MKISVFTFLFCVHPCTYSHSQDTQSHTALDRVQAGKDISFGRYILHVEKQTGDVVEGVRIVGTNSSGHATTTTAKKGTLQQGADRSFITIVLHDAVYEEQAAKGMRIALVKEYAIKLPINGQ
jgi:hypothetical protein